jgi:hypothetical protein
MIPLNLRLRYSIRFLWGMISKFFLKKPDLRSITSCLGILFFLKGHGPNPSSLLSEEKEGSGRLVQLLLTSMKNALNQDEKSSPEIWLI